MKKETLKKATELNLIIEFLEKALPKVKEIKVYTWANGSGFSEETHKEIKEIVTEVESITISLLEIKMQKLLESKLKEFENLKDETVK